MTKAILFDLDGTLVDTAQDFAAILNDMLVARQQHALDFVKFRQVVGLGANKMIQHAFAVDESDEKFAQLKNEFLGQYEQKNGSYATLFPGVNECLNYLDERQIPWGIVTNKNAKFTTVLLQKLQLEKRAACLICGDTIPYAKPRPEPILAACDLLKIQAAEAVYVGDSMNDILAGKAAGMPTIAAAYGYVSQQTKVKTWDADGIVEESNALLGVIKRVCRLEQSCIKQI